MPTIIYEWRNNTTHLDVMKSIFDTDPWEIIHRLWSCMGCPKLAKCNKLSGNKTKEKDVCRVLINEWLNEEVTAKE